MYSAVYRFVRFWVSLWLLPGIRATLHAAYDEQQDAPRLRPSRDHALGVLGFPSPRFQPTSLYAKGRCACETGKHVGFLLSFHAWLTARTVAATATLVALRLGALRAFFRRHGRDGHGWLTFGCS